MNVPWRWLVSGAVAIGVGLAVWFTAFVLVPAGVVLIAVGITKLIGGGTSGATPHSKGPASTS